MKAPWPTQAAPLPKRFRAVVVAGVTGILTLGLLLGLPVAVFLLTAAILLLTHFNAAVHTAREVGPLRDNPRTAHDDDDEDPAASFAEHFVAKEFGAARRGRDVTLVMFGFKDFDAFAEREGSRAAGEAVREFGRLLRKLTRQMNLSARYGWRADTFLSVLSDADARAAEGFIARVRGAVATSKVKMPELDAGVAVYQPHLASPDEFVDCAKRALLAARAVTDYNPGEVPLPPGLAAATRAPAAAQPRTARGSKTPG